jgi:hypothetical protein
VKATSGRDALGRDIITANWKAIETRYEAMIDEQLELVLPLSYQACRFRDYDNDLKILPITATRRAEKAILKRRKKTAIPHDFGVQTGNASPTRAEFSRDSPDVDVHMQVGTAIAPTSYSRGDISPERNVRKYLHLIRELLYGRRGIMTIYLLTPFVLCRITFQPDQFLNLPACHDRSCRPSNWATRITYEPERPAGRNH